MASRWPMVRLSEVLDLYREYIDAPEPREYRKLSVRLYGKGVVLDTPADGSTLRMKRHQIAKAGQVILSEIWGKRGAIGFVPPEGSGALCTSHFFLFDVREDRVERGYLQAIFTANYLQDQLDAAARGTTGYAAVRPNQLLEMTIPLPPLAEQRRIVARIEELAAKIEEARGLRSRAGEETEALARGLLDKAYAEAAGKYGLAELAQLSTSITDGDHLTPRFASSGVKFIFVGNVSSGRLHFRDCKHVSREYYASLSDKRKPERGDVLYSAVGATLGVPAVVDTDEQFCFQRHVAIIKPDRARLLPQFAWHMLRSGTVYRKAWEETTGSAQPTVPLRAIRTLPVPVPPLAEQRRIVAYLDGLGTKVDAFGRLQGETVAELDALLPAVLKRAFAGDL